MPATSPKRTIATAIATIIFANLGRRRERLECRQIGVANTAHSDKFHLWRGDGGRVRAEMLYP
jgi:hypothetical protein